MVIEDELCNSPNVKEALLGGHDGIMDQLNYLNKISILYLEEHKESSTYIFLSRV